jgi:hypothetical protein
MQLGGLNIYDKRFSRFNGLERRIFLITGVCGDGYSHALYY